MSKNILIGLIGFAVLVVCILTGVALDNADKEIRQLQSELNYYKNKPPRFIVPSGESDLDESDKAMMEVIKKIAEIESANITIDTPEGHFHFEWQR